MIYNVGLFNIDNKTNELDIEYIVENDNEGVFTFNNVNNGKYILIVLSSEIINIFEDIRFFDYSISSEIININNSSSLNNSLYLSIPAERLSIKSIGSVNNHYGKISLNNASGSTIVISS